LPEFEPLEARKALMGKSMQVDEEIIGALPDNEILMRE